MVLDARRRKIWLHGGFDGASDLADLWTFDLNTGRWTCVHPNTEAVGGPCGRSCHSLVLDPPTGDLYLLGRYAERADIRAKKERRLLKAAAKAAGEKAAQAAEAEGRGQEAVQQAREEAVKQATAAGEAGEGRDAVGYRSDFWKFVHDEGRWECLSADTSVSVLPFTSPIRTPS